MAKIAVVTAITGGKDRLRTDQVWGSADWFAFVDSVVGGSVGQWQLRQACNLFRCDNRNAKLQKVLTTDCFPDYDASIWLDGNIALKVSPEEAIGFLGIADIALHAHPDRDNIRDEAAASTQVKYDPFLISKQVQWYEDYGLVSDSVGLYECGVILRRHSPAVASFDRRWWAEICRWSQQDQLSFPVAASNIAISTIPGSITANTSPIVHYRGHARAG